jgi:putative membrane protein
MSLSSDHVGLLSGSEEHKPRFYDEIYSTVIPQIYIHVISNTAWAAFISFLYLYGKLEFLAIKNFIMTVITVVMGFLLVFRTNSSYDRFWEARKIWGTIITHIRRIAMIIWIQSRPKSDKDSNEKEGGMNLLLAFPIALKHHLRSETNVLPVTLQKLLIHIPQFHSKYRVKDSNVPYEILIHLHTYIRYLLDNNRIDQHTCNSIMNSITVLLESLASFERIRTTPVPIAYTTHLKQTISIYLLSLPFQIIKDMNWNTITVVFFASFCFLGIERLGQELENPFGFDQNDLKMDSFCNEILRDVIFLMETPISDPTDWNQASDLEMICKERNYAASFTYTESNTSLI